MTTRRTTMKSSAGKSGAMHRVKLAHAPELRREAGAEAGAMKAGFDKRLRRARRSAERFARTSMEQATVASTAVRRSMREALAALKRATHEAAKRVYDATAPAKPAPAAKRRAPKAGHGLTA